MIEHPWTELQVLIKEKWLTQKAFALILWKKVSEVNELLKWKRNITIQRDYLLHQTLWTPIKYWILKQVDYDYSLIDIEESSLSTPQSLRDSSPNREQNSDDDFTPLWGGDGEARGGWLQHTESSWAIAKDLRWETDFSPDRGSGEAEGVITQETPIQEPDSKDDEDHKKRARIFKSF